MNKKKTLVLALAVIISAVMFLAGCGGSKTDYSTLQQDVVKSGSVFVTDSDVVFFGYNNLLCTALFKDGTIYDFVVEAGFTGDVYALAVYDGALYVSASDGIFKYDLEMFSGSGTASPVVLWDKNLSRFNNFQIYDGKMFFLYGVTLTYIPLEGGEAVSLATEVGDFEVTNAGIYYSKKDGSLHLLSTDFSEDKAIGEVTPAAHLSLGNGSIYFKDGQKLMVFSLDKAEVSEVETGAPLNEYCHPWINGSSIAYDDADYVLRLITADGEKAGDQMLDFPDKAMGYMYKDWLVSQTTYYRSMDVIDFTNGTFVAYNLEDELADYLGKVTGGSSGGTDNGGSSGGPSTSDDYDINAHSMREASGDGTIQYMYFNDFMITMPNNDKWGYEYDKDSVTFFLQAARADGLDGRLVTIKAYDMDDNSYEQLPSYHVAGVGKNVNKRFIAIYPTDVQWNHEDAQQEADYRDLYDYLQKIGEGAVNSPLQTADSD